MAGDLTDYALDRYVLGHCIRDTDPAGQERQMLDTNVLGALVHEQSHAKNRGGSCSNI